jgi:hypothetical protein
MSNDSFSKLFFRGNCIGKLCPYKKWAFTIKQKHGTLGDFVNSLRSDRTEVAAKVARFCFVNATIFPVAQFAYAVTSEL